MTAPEPVEVPAAELAAARLAEDERLVREHAKGLDAHGPTVPGPLTVLLAEYDRMRDRLLRIAEAHSKSIDSAGGTWGDCAECGWSWPCPTNVWATTSRDVLAPWIPAGDEERGDE